MEKQRHAQRVLDEHTATTFPTLVTPNPIEVHARKIYTRTIFLKVQMEILKGSWICSQTTVTIDGNDEVYTIKHSNKASQDHLQFKVVQNVESGNISCSCNHFGRHGYLCRHIFCVFKNKSVTDIPGAYISRRWKRDVIPRHLLHDRQRYGNKNSEAGKIVSQVLEKLELCFSGLRSEPDKLSDFVPKINKLTDETLSTLPQGSGKKSKNEVFQELLGVTEPEEVSILPPSLAKNKGSRTNPGKRMVAPGEKHAKKRTHQMCECNYCHQFQDNHDQRNCPNKKAKLEAERAAKRSKIKAGRAAEESVSQAPAASQDITIRNHVAS